MSEIELYQRGVIFKTKTNMVTNDQFYSDMDKVWNLYCEFKAKGLKPNEEYLNSRLPAHFYDIVPFRDKNGVEERFQEEMYKWVINCKRIILSIMNAVFYHAYDQYQNSRYLNSLQLFKDVSKQKYYVVDFTNLLGSRAQVCFKYYEGAVFKEYGLSPIPLYRDSPNEVCISIPTSRNSPEGLYKDPEIQELAYCNIMNFFGDNSINLLPDRYYYNYNLIDDSIYKIALVIPYRDLKKL